MNDRRKIQEDKYYCFDNEPNAVGLICLTQRAAVVLGKDNLKLLHGYRQPSKSNVLRYLANYKQPK